MEENKLNPHAKVVIVGGSAGSLEVLLQVLPKLQNIESLVILLIVHRRNSDDNFLEELIRMKSGLKVKEVEDKTPIKVGHVYVAPADYHLLIENNLSFSLDVSEKVNYSRPSIDVGFESAADVFGTKLVAILLSGANNDGTNGLLAVKENGGIVIIQKPETAEVPYMPAHAIKNLDADYILSANEIAVFIKGLVGKTS
ncbi:chemotaxis protein CheB [Flavobacterium sp.]|uniref:chemotaxis protein CheB n=1 Tax=Flavobacterium sp. TaxID=239 RepID=UPI00248A14C9|nr:chemotaxis protein CheB [Flavobacterium sp.]MDI1318404.1 chemotaxis protein CheB [Flavobacterium sp.]